MAGIRRRRPFMTWCRGEPPNPRGHQVRLFLGRIAPESLPRLLTTDAVAQYYHWPVGTIVEIERRFGGHETLLYYRRVS